MSANVRWILSQYKVSIWQDILLGKDPAIFVFTETHGISDLSSWPWKWAYFSSDSSHNYGGILCGVRKDYFPKATLFNNFYQYCMVIDLNNDDDLNRIIAVYCPTKLTPAQLSSLGYDNFRSNPMDDFIIDIFHFIAEHTNNHSITTGDFNFVMNSMDRIIHSIGLNKTCKQYSWEEIRTNHWNEAFENIPLIDVSTNVGPHYTRHSWAPDGRLLRASRIDRTYITLDSKIGIADVKVQFPREDASDHCITTILTSIKDPSRWTFNSVLLYDRLFLNLLATNIEDCPTDDIKSLSEIIKNIQINYMNLLSSCDPSIIPSYIESHEIAKSLYRATKIDSPVKIASRIVKRHLSSSLNKKNLEIFSKFYEDLFNKRNVTDEVDPAEFYTKSSKTDTSKLTEDEILEFLDDLPKNRSVGPDGIPNELLIDLFKKFPEKFIYQFNYWWEGNLVEDYYKEGIISCINKKLSPSDNPSNYRPITLLNHVWKLYTRCVLYRIYDESILHKLQRGWKSPKNLKTKHDVRF